MKTATNSGARLSLPIQHIQIIAGGCGGVLGAGAVAAGRRDYRCSTALMRVSCSLRRPSWLAALARQSVPKGQPTHSRDLMLAAVADVLDEMTDGPGVVLALAPAFVVRQAAQAQAYVLQPTDAHRAPAGPAPARLHRTLPA